MKRIACFALMLALLVLLGAGCSRNSNGQLWQLLEKEDYDLFINYVDGYELRLDRGWQVDMSLAGVVTVLEKEDTRVEIYRQELGDVSAKTYLNYSNRFLDNTIDHVLDYEKSTTSFGRRVRLTGWHREKLSRVDGDQNYYFEMDIVKLRAVYTILIKSAAPLTEPEAYIGWLTHFKTFHTDAEAPAWTT